MDDEALDMLLARNVPMTPALYFEHASIVRGPEFGLSQAVIDGHKETLEGGAASALKVLRAGGLVGMGGDYGFAWNPHGDYAREIAFFVDYVGFTPLEAITCATRTGATILGREKELGTLEAGKLGDVLVVGGDVLADVPLLQDRSKILAVVQGGVLKAGTLTIAG
jgi:imidazolonepropionase-like amidohydrolase